jgi:hypothetical protein
MSHHPILQNLSLVTLTVPLFFQDYYINNPSKYYYYRGLCGRDLYLDSVWGKGQHY